MYICIQSLVLMGASIGRNVKIHRDAKIGQADLLTIGDNVCIDNAVLRPFSIEEVYILCYILPYSILCMHHESEVIILILSYMWITINR